MVLYDISADIGLQKSQLTGSMVSFDSFPLVEASLARKPQVVTARLKQACWDFHVLFSTEFVVVQAWGCFEL